MRKSVPVLLAATALTAATALPAAAGQTAGTTTNFTLTGGGLDIIAPTGPVSLGTASVGTVVISGSLGAVAVTDNRGLDPAAWIASVASTGFVGNVTPSHTILASNVAYAPGAMTSQTGNAVITPSSIPVPPGLSPTPKPVVTATAGTGNNSAAWNPNITVTIPPADAVIGTYTATVTHSLA